MRPAPDRVQLAGRRRCRAQLPSHRRRHRAQLPAARSSPAAAAAVRRYWPPARATPTRRPAVTRPSRSRRPARRRRRRPRRALPHRERRHLAPSSWQPGALSAPAAGASAEHRSLRRGPQGASQRAAVLLAVAALVAEPPRCSAPPPCSSASGTRPHAHPGEDAAPRASRTFRHRAVVPATCSSLCALTSGK